MGTPQLTRLPDTPVAKDHDFVHAEPTARRLRLDELLGRFAPVVLMFRGVVGGGR